MDGDSYMKYIIESRDGFKRVFQHAYEITLDDGWFCITDENSIRWEFNIRYHEIHKIYEKGDWEFITDKIDILSVQNGIDLLRKTHLNTTFEIPAIKKYDGKRWYATVYKMGSPISYKIIL